MAVDWTPRRVEAAAILGVQGALLVVASAVTTYSDAGQRKAPPDADVVNYYPMFQDVHVMMVVGFGFLMTFLRRYGYSAVAFNLLLVALLSQWAVLCRGFYDRDPKDGLIHVGLPSLLRADLTVATILISMGAVLGKVSPLQLLVMGLVETAVCTANEHLGMHVFKAADAGGSVFVHAFGAYFGLAVSLVLGHGATLRRKNSTSGDLEGASYNSDLFAMIGTAFLWCFWPSFNGALAAGDERTRAIVNTYLALGASTAAAVAASALFSRDSKISMVHAQNATLAGGVAVGAACDMLLQPGGAVAIGAVAGVISTLGFRYLQPLLVERLALHDTCGVHNLHGMPALLAGLTATAAAAAASESSYGASLYRVFEARAAQTSSDVVLEAGRSAGAQAGYQLLALVLTVVIAIITGVITGFILRLPALDHMAHDMWFSDAGYWELPEEGWKEERLTVVAERGIDNQAHEDDTKLRERPLDESQLHI